MSDRGDYSIRIVDDDGNPVSGKKVELIFWGTLGGSWEDGHTDGDGWAQFSNCPCHIRYVTVDGNILNDSDFVIDDGDTRSFTI